MGPRAEATHAPSAGWRRFAAAAAVVAAVVAVALASPAEFRPARAQGLGDLLIWPTRIVFSGRMRSAEVTLINRGTGPATYRISFENMRMTDEGRLEVIEEPAADAPFADKFLRYSPRQVVLGPGAEQTVRLLVRKPRDLAHGEYRSHLLFRAVPPPTTGDDIEALEEGEIRINLIPIYGVSIPVIVRHGELSASVTISDVALRPPRNGQGLPRLFMRLNRSGDASVYGDFKVSFTAAGGTPTDVGLVRGIAVYTPNQSRTFEFTLQPPEGLKLERGRLEVVYHEPPSQGGSVLATAELRLP